MHLIAYYTLFAVAYYLSKTAGHFIGGIHWFALSVYSTWIWTWVCDHMHDTSSSYDTRGIIIRSGLLWKLVAYESWQFKGKTFMWPPYGQAFRECIKSYNNYLKSLCDTRYVTIPGSTLL